MTKKLLLTSILGTLMFASTDVPEVLSTTYAEQELIKTTLKNKNRFNKYAEVLLSQHPSIEYKISDTCSSKEVQQNAIIKKEITKRLSPDDRHLISKLDDSICKNNQYKTIFKKYLNKLSKEELDELSVLISKERLDVINIMKKYPKEFKYLKGDKS